MFGDHRGIGYDGEAIGPDAGGVAVRGLHLLPGSEAGGDGPVPRHSGRAVLCSFPGIRCPVPFGSLSTCCPVSFGSPGAGCSSLRRIQCPHHRGFHHILAAAGRGRS